MALAYLALGTNLGNKQKNLNDAIIALSINIGSVLSVSSFYNSEPWGFVSDNKFLNAVLLIDTHLSPLQLLDQTQKIEQQMGRKAKIGTAYEDRVVDIDILLYDNLIIDQPRLKIPHPLMLERDFVLKPLAEIAGDVKHPKSGERISDIVL